MVEPVGVLKKIAEAKRAELLSRYQEVSLDALRSRATPTSRSLAAVLSNGGARFILEIKKASPSAGAIRPNADPGALARGYAGVADALSVLCDRAYFGGSLEDLSAARAHFDGPILAKDFFIDRRQVAEARIAGADAVLVMLSLLDDARAREIIAEAGLFGMDALVEVHDEAEMYRALELGAPLIGINNRDLRDLSIDLSTTERLAPLAGNRILVSESGIEQRSDIERLSRSVDGFLIGSSLMLAAEPAQAARALIFGRTKLCGLNSLQSIEAARPAAYAGLMFVEDTPRYVTASGAAPLAEAARKHGILPVGVFRDLPIAEVARIASTLSLHAVQLHGREDVDYVHDLRAALPEPSEIWTAVSVGRDPLEGRGGSRILFDNAGGGSGQSFDWSLVERHPDLPRALIGGGIGPINARAAASIGAFAIDVGSAVDERPGVKSSEKIAALFDILRHPARERATPCA